MVKIHVLQASGRFTLYTKKIEKVARLAIKKVTAKIPVDNVDIVFCDNPWGVIPEIGIGANTINAFLIFIYLDPVFKHFNKTINLEIERTIAHELYHCLRYPYPGYGRTLLGALVGEGLADHFDIEVTGSKPAIWDAALSAVQMAKLGESAKKEYKNKNYNHFDWFYGSEKRGMPKWTGYTLGFKLVEDYLIKNSDLKPSSLFKIKPEKLIA